MVGGWKNTPLFRVTELHGCSIFSLQIEFLKVLFFYRLKTRTRVFYFSLLKV